MRDTRFRGKAKAGNKWIYGYLIKYHGDYYILTPKAKSFLGGFLVVIPETVGQFTGLCDANGKEAFRRDTVSFKGRPYGIIEYCENSGGWQLLDWQSRTYLTGLSQNLMNDLVIIGNIHENGDLLEPAK